MMAPGLRERVEGPPPPPLALLVLQLACKEIQQRLAECARAATALIFLPRCSFGLFKLHNVSGGARS